MTNRHHHHRRRREGRPETYGCGAPPHRRGPIGRVAHGLAERWHVHHHTVIAGFVLGFIFVPMLTLLVFLGALYWVNDPARTERRIDRVIVQARAAYRAHRERHTRRAREHPPASDAAPPPVPDFPELRRKFEELEARARAMESCVASEEFTLNRQFRAMGR